MAGLLPVGAIAVRRACGTSPLVALTKPLPADSALIDRFRQRRAEFEELRHRLTEGPVVLSASCQPTPERCLARIASLSASLRILPGAMPTATNELHLPVFAYNLPSNGPTKGYAWRRHPLPAAAARLDWYCRSDGEWRAYRPLGDGWYLYLEWGD